VPGADPSDLASLPLVDSLSESEIAEVAAWFEVKEVGSGVRLAGEGATGHAFFVLCEGEASVTARATRSRRSTPATSSARSPCSGKGGEPRR